MSEEPQKPPSTVTREVINYLKSQSPETVLLCLLLVAFVYGVYLAGSALFHEIPSQIKQVTDAHERAIERVSKSHELRSAEDKQLINKLLDRAGVVRATDPRNIANQ